jgi:hypothetical protein
MTQTKLPSDVEELDDFEKWFASKTRAEQQDRFKHSYYMREAWNAARASTPTDKEAEPNICEAGSLSDVCWLELSERDDRTSPEEYPDMCLITRDELSDFISRARSASVTDEADNQLTFQNRVKPWMLACFGPVIPFDKTERNHRFLEEALELVQSLGCTQSEAHQLVDYVFCRPVGEPHQEVGGVMVTLAALCIANSMDMELEGETELARIWKKVEQIRAKQAAKPKHSPLPGPSPTPPAHGEGELREAWKQVRKTLFAHFPDGSEKQCLVCRAIIDEGDIDHKENCPVETLIRALSHAPSPPQEAPVDMVLFCPRCGRQHVGAVPFVSPPQQDGSGLVDDAMVERARLTQIALGQPPSDTRAIRSMLESALASTPKAGGEQAGNYKAQALASRRDEP